MSELIALAVRGDAFIYQRSSATALIDGGGSSMRLGKELARELPAVNHLDVVVCTHADLDHANGLKSILSHWRAAKGGHASIGEFWLPGRWMDVARLGLKDPEGLVSEIILALDDGTLNLPHYKLRDAYREDWDIALEGMASGDLPVRVWVRLKELFLDASPDDRAEFRRLNLTDLFGADDEIFGETEAPSHSPYLEPSEDKEFQDYAKPFEPKWLRELRERRFGVPDENEMAVIFSNARRKVFYRMGQQPHLGKRGLPKTVGTSVATGLYCLALIDAAEAIVRIANHALNEGVPIRWFDQERYVQTGRAQGGRSDFLLPMNSVELRSMPTTIKVPVVFYLALSISNRESLAFYAPAEAGFHGVVFCADTRLGTGIGGGKPFQSYPSMARSCQIGTAPHHGAESAARAYSFASKFGIVHWVCSANGRTTPGKSFQKIPHSQRCCTACPLIGRPFSSIKIDLKLVGFTLPNTCVCP